jgi:hypothetical protein
MDNPKTFAWQLRLMTGLRRLAAIVPWRRGREDEQPDTLPPFPHDRESSALIPDELAHQGGPGTGEQESPHPRPRWLTLPESVLREGVFRHRNHREWHDQCLGLALVRQAIARSRSAGPVGRATGRPPAAGSSPRERRRP